MTRRCSHCGNNGHNSRTCITRGSGACGGGVKLFGVLLRDGSTIKKSVSMGNLSAAHYHSSSSAAASPNPDSPLSDHLRDRTQFPEGYLSDDTTHGSGSTRRRGERRKGVPWTEEEHLQFLMGLDKLGKGNWRGIAREYVVSRTPTQVASHAQKYFNRQNNSARRKRRSSLFDMVPADDMVTTTVPEEQVLLASPEARETDNANSLPSLNLLLKSEFEPTKAERQETTKQAEETSMPSSRLTSMVPGFFPGYLPVPYSFWPNAAPLEEERVAEVSQCQVLKPIPVLRKEPVNVDELVGMYKLSIGETEGGHTEPSPNSLELLGESRQSAFHVIAPVSGSYSSKGNSAIQAV